MRYPAVIFGVALFAIGPAGAQVISVTPQALPRHFGYFVGDTMTATSVITVGPGVTLDANTLPVPGPAATAIDIRSVETHMSGRLADQHKYGIAVTYQDFVAPDRAVKIDVPGYRVGFLQAGKPLNAVVTGFSFTASPFRDDIQPVLDPSVLQPDHAAIWANEAQPAWLLAAGLAMAALAALGLLMQNIHLPGWGRRMPPFAAAARRIARRPPVSQTAATDALLTLHEAFDATAGRRVFADDLEYFVSNYRHFAPLHADLERFFDLSRTAFFGAGALPDELTGGMLKTLSRDLMRAERQR